MEAHMTTCGNAKNFPALVSVIIPARNAADVLGDQLEALSGQDYEGVWEVIVADNASTDATSEVVKRWAERLLSLRIVSAADRLGASHARNLGAACARGDLLLFCDADDTAAPGWLAAMAASSRIAHIGVSLRNVSPSANRAVLAGQRFNW